MITTTRQPLALSVIDLCKRAPTESAKQSLEKTLALAELVDSLSYKRFWVGEHHVADVAEACPEILVALIASRTKNIRVGSGGVLLRYYSPLKVAETFLTIEALYPGRIDLGVCKGPGAFPSMAEVLVGGNTLELGDDVFERKVADLIGYLRQAPASPDSAQEKVVRAYPWGVAPPPVWVLGSGTKSMVLASQLGTAYSFTLFFDGRQTYGPGLMEDYQRKFSPSPEQAAPHTSIAVSMICMEDETDALAFEARMVIDGNLPSTIVGNPRYCYERLQQLAAQYGTNEILIATWQNNYRDRANLYRWMAEYNHSYDQVPDAEYTAVSANHLP